MAELAITTPEVTRSLRALDVSPNYLPTLGLANFGIYVALLTPVFGSMAFKFDHITASRGESLAALGVTMGVGSLFAIVFNPLIGRLSDRTMSQFGMRRPWLLIGVLVGFTGLTMIGLATSTTVVLVGWCITQGGLNGALAALNATIPDRMPPWTRGRASSVIGITTSLGLLAGTLAMKLLPTDVNRFTVPGLICLVLTTGFVLTLKDDRQRTTPAQRYGWNEFIGSFVFNPRKNPDFAWMWLTTFLMMFGHSGIAIYLPLYLTDIFHLPESEAINVVLIANAAAVGAQAVSGSFTGYLSDRLGRRRPFVLAGGMLMVTGLMILGFAPSTTFVILGQGLIGLGVGAFLSVSLALVTQVLPGTQDTAKDLGVINIANALPQTITPGVAPLLISLGATTAIGGYPLLYLAAASATLLGTLAVLRIKNTK